MNRAILERDATTEVTILEMEEEIGAGPILLWIARRDRAPLIRQVEWGRGPYARLASHGEILRTGGSLATGIVLRRG
jgi:hypothetical protein